VGSKPQWPRDHEASRKSSPPLVRPSGRASGASITFFDPNAERDEAEVSLAEDRDQPSEWRVEYFHKADGYVTIFAGPMAEERARDYFNALKSGRLGIIRDNGQG
jgi:hypothetical protein